jgi:Arc/MetJ-type ribon-helix-helix transcriptional regulator
MHAKEARMAEAVIKLRLNQQQLELMDRTIARGVAPDRAALVRLALREYAAARKAETDVKPSDLEPVR